MRARGPHCIDAVRLRGLVCPRGLVVGPFLDGGVVDARRAENSESTLLMDAALKGRTALTRQLVLDDNQLTELPERIGDLTALKELWLGNNQLVDCAGKSF